MGSAFAGGTGALAPFQEEAGVFISCSFGSCRGHSSSITWLSSTNMKILETKLIYSVSLIPVAQLGLTSAYLLPGRDTSPHKAQLCGGTKPGLYNFGMKVKTQM